MIAADPKCYSTLRILSQADWMIRLRDFRFEAKSK
jgi:hypothetical protein